MSNRIRIQGMAAMAWTIVATGVPLVGCSRTPRVARIGVAQPLTGPLAALGQDMVDGVTFAIEGLNREGFRFKGDIVPWEAVIVDDRADPVVGVDVARQLADTDVLAVVGHLNSGVSIAAAPVYAAKGIPQLAISTHPRYTQLSLKTTFRLVANDTLQEKALAGFALERFPRAMFAVLDDGSVYGRGLADGAEAVLTQAGQTVSLRQSFNDKTTSFASVAGKIKSLGVSCILSTLNDFQVVALARELIKVAHADVALVGGDTAKTTATLEAPLLGGGIYATSPVIQASDFPAGVRFVEEFRLRFHKDPVYAAHYAYDAVHAVASLLRRLERLNRADLLEALPKADLFAPVTGSMKFDARGEQRYGAVAVYGIRDKHWDLLVRSDQW